MALPNNALSSVAYPAAVLAPDGRVRADLTVDYELGGIGLSDASQGLQVQVWRGYVDNGLVYLVPETGGTPSPQFAVTSLTELSIAFDQNMRPTIAYIEGGETKLFWYDSALPGQTTTTFAGITSPFLTLDDKRAVQLGGSDLLLFYVRDQSLYYRQQRERFTTERLLTALPSYASRIISAGMGVNGRMQVQVTGDYTGVHVDLLADTLYMSGNDSVFPQRQGTVQTALWRSKVFVDDNHPSFAWGRIEGEYPVVLRVYGDGVLRYTSPSITSRTPFRLPSGRYREWQIEVESASIVTEVRLAGTAVELKD